MCQNTIGQFNVLMVIQQSDGQQEHEAEGRCEMTTHVPNMSAVHLYIPCNI